MIQFIVVATRASCVVVGCSHTASSADVACANTFVPIIVRERIVQSIERLQ